MKKYLLTIVTTLAFLFGAVEVPTANADGGAKPGFGAGKGKGKFKGKRGKRGRKGKGKFKSKKGASLQHVAPSPNAIA